MFPTIRGWRFTVALNQSSAGPQRESVVVAYDGCETEQQAVGVLLDSVRNGYPEGNIDIESVQEGKWCPTGPRAHESHLSYWVN